MKNAKNNTLSEMDAYVYWVEHKRCLEEIMQKNKALTKIELLIGEELASFQSELKKSYAEMNLLQETCGDKLPPSNYKQIKEAKQAFEEIVRELCRRQDEYLALAPQISKQIKKWSTSTPPEKEQKLADIMELSLKYSSAADFNQEMFVEEIVLNHFYIDLSELHFVSSPEQTEKIRPLLSKPNTIEELITFKQDFEHNIWQKANKITEKIKSKHYKKLSSEERMFLDAFPPPQFTAIWKDLETIMTNPVKFLQTKKSISSKTEELQEEYSFMTTCDPELNRDYIERVIKPIEKVTKPIEIINQTTAMEAMDYNLDSLFLKQVIAEQDEIIKSLTRTKEKISKRKTFTPQKVFGMEDIF